MQHGDHARPADSFAAAAVSLSFAQCKPCKQTGTVSTLVSAPLCCRNSSLLGKQLLSQQHESLECLGGHSSRSSSRQLQRSISETRHACKQLSNSSNRTARALPDLQMRQTSRSSCVQSSQASCQTSGSASTPNHNHQRLQQQPLQQRSQRHCTGSKAGCASMTVHARICCAELSVTTICFAANNCTRVKAYVSRSGSVVD